MSYNTSYIQPTDGSSLYNTTLAVTNVFSTVQAFVTNGINTIANGIFNTVYPESLGVVDGMNNAAGSLSAYLQNGQIDYTADPDAVSAQINAYYAQANMLNTEMTDVSAEANAKISNLNTAINGLNGCYQNFAASVTPFVTGLYEEDSATYSPLTPPANVSYATSYIQPIDVSSLNSTVMQVQNGMATVSMFVSNDINAQANAIFSATQPQSVDTMNCINNAAGSLVASFLNGQIIFSVDPTIVTAQISACSAQATVLNTEMTDVSAEANAKLNDFGNTMNDLGSCLGSFAMPLLYPIVVGLPSQNDNTNNGNGSGNVPAPDNSGDNGSGDGTTTTPNDQDVTGDNSNSAYDGM
jgi:hypothetical protein